MLLGFVATYFRETTFSVMAAINSKQSSLLMLALL
jgi:hypothetical protein